MTPDREQKFKNVISKRQPDLTVVLENVHDPHNISAILRTCDAVGIREIYVLNTISPKPTSYGKRSSSSAIKWVDINFFDKIEPCLEVVKKNYDEIFSTYLGEVGQDIYDLDLTGSLALLFGNEKEGLSKKILSYSDGNFIIPQIGMIPSLNISVACAITLYETYRQRKEKGLYNKVRLSQEESKSMYSNWSDIQLRQGR